MRGSPSDIRSAGEPCMMSWSCIGLSTYGRHSGSSPSTRRMAPSTLICSTVSTTAPLFRFGSMLGQVFAIYCNVLEVDANGKVLNEGDAQYRAAQWIRAHCDQGYRASLRSRPGTPKSTAPDQADSCRRTGTGRRPYWWAGWTRLLRYRGRRRDAPPDGNPGGGAATQAFLSGLPCERSRYSPGVSCRNSPGLASAGGYVGRRELAGVELSVCGTA